MSDIDPGIVRAVLFIAGIAIVAVVVAIKIGRKIDKENK